MPRSADKELTQQPFKLGNYTIRPDLNELDSGAATVHVKPKSMAVLLCLAEAAGNVCSRDHIFKQVWGEAELSDEVLTQAIAELRRALADDSRHPKVIQTIPRRGYRLVQPMNTPDPAAETMTTEGIQKPDANRTSWWAKRKLGVLVAVLVVGIMVSLYINWQKDETVVTTAVQHASNPMDQKSTTPIADQSIAVLPFVNMSGNAENEYFSDGIAEQLLHGLTNLGALKVAARTSSFYFKNKKIDIRTIGEKLQVATVLEGSVRRSDQQVRINAQLINVADGYHLWSQTYDRKLVDIFAVQDEIALAIVNELKVELGITTEAKPVVDTGTRNAEAYTAYLQGVYHVRMPGDEEFFKKSIANFKRAVKLDPNYANAWGYLALSYIYWSFSESFDTVGPPAKRAFDRALALDPQNGEALAAKGAYTLHKTWDWREAQQFFALALRSKAERSGMLQAYVNWILLPLKQTAMARQLLQEAELNDPYSVPVKAGLTLIALSEQRWKKVILKGKEMDYLEPDSLGKIFQCIAYYALGDQESLKTLAEDYKQLNNICNFYLELNKGNTIEAEAIATSLSLAAKLYPILGIFSATVELKLGNEEKAIDALEQVYNDRVAYSKYARFVPRLEANPRYQALLKKMNLDDASIAELEQTVDF